MGLHDGHVNSMYLTPRPNDRDTLAALTFLGRVLDAPAAFQANGRFYFRLDERWALAVSPDDAGRFRVGAWHGSVEVATLWARSGDWRRLADLALALRAEIAALAA